MSDRTGPPPEVVTFGDGRYLIVDGTRRRIAFAARSGSTAWVFLDGAVHVSDAAPARRQPVHGQGDDALAAPMPATVLRVDVQPGQALGRGDTVVVLEAMKMELPLKMPRDGVVKSIRCRPGELVQPGVPLVELE